MCAALTAVAELRAGDEPTKAVEVRPPVSAPKPKGDYELVALTLKPGPPRVHVKGGIATPESQPLQLAFRDGKLVNYWPESSGWTFERTREMTCSLDDERLAGRLGIATYLQATPSGWLDLSFDLVRRGEDLSGSCQIKASFETVYDTAYPQTKTAVDFPLTVSVSGSVLTFDGNAIASGAKWPTLRGPRRTMEAQGPALVDDLAAARPVWRSEATIPVSYGGAPDLRYAGNSRASRTGGGSSSPVLVDGVIYQGFYRPNRTADIAIPSWVPARQWQGKTLDEFTAGWHPGEKQDLEDFFRVAADDHVVAIDARTGQTLWETVWPQRSYNVQTHKHRGLFGVPLIAGGKVFVFGRTARLCCLDGATGILLWDVPVPKWHAALEKSRQDAIAARKLVTPPSHYPPLYHADGVVFGERIQTGTVWSARGGPGSVAFRTQEHPARVEFASGGVTTACRSSQQTSRNPRGTGRIGTAAALARPAQGLS